MRARGPATSPPPRAQADVCDGPVHGRAHGGAYLADGFDPLESASVGERFELRGAQAAPAEMIIVGIDDATLKKLRTSYPFSRKHHAEALDRIADGKPRAIAYDVVFTQRIDSSADYRRFGE